MKLALFTDATCQPSSKKTGLSVVVIDVTDPARPFEIFCRTDCLPYCDSTEAEHRATLLGIAEVLPAVVHGGGKVDSVTLFTDAEAVIDESKKPILRALKLDIRDKLELIRSHGCFVAIEVIPRRLNRRADAMSRAAIRGRNSEPAVQRPEVFERFPYLAILNS